MYATYLEMAPKIKQISGWIENDKANKGRCYLQNLGGGYTCENSFNFAVCLKLHNILFFWKKNVSTKFHILNGANFFQTYKASLEEGRPQTQVNIS